MLEARNLTCVRGDRTLFRDVSFTVSPGTLLQVEGPNGSGKTSLLRIVCGLMQPVAGEVLWQEKKIHDQDESFTNALSYLGHRNGIKEELTPLENLHITCGLAGAAIPTETAVSALKRVGLETRQNLPSRFLSEGQKRRSALARLIARDSELWVLDEVLAALDSGAMALVRSLIDEHLGRGGMAIVATHQELQLKADAIKRLDLGTAVSSSVDSSE